MVKWRNVIRKILLHEVPNINIDKYNFKPPFLKRRLYKRSTVFFRSGIYCIRFVFEIVVP